MTHYHCGRVVLVALVAAACSPDQSVGPSRGVIAAYVTGEAERNLDQNGQFVLTGGSVGELTESEAMTLAKAYARVGARWMGETWQRDRRSRIDFDRLTPCPRALYAKSSFVLGQRGSPSLRQLIGPKWLIAMCSESGPPVLSIAVSAEATDLRVIDGHILGPGGAQFTSAGIPVSRSDVPISPEDAVNIVAKATGRRVLKVPELVLAPPPYPPQLAKWRIQLELPVTVRGVRSGSRRTTSEVYVGFGETWNSVYIQLGDTDGATRSFRDAEGRGAEVTFPIIPGYPTRFERANVEVP